MLKEKEIARLKEQQRKELEKAKLEAEKKKKKAQTITEAEIKRKPKKQPEEVVESVETVLPDSGTDTNIQNEDIIEINLFDGTDDING